MKLSQLRRIIQEEIYRALNESVVPWKEWIKAFELAIENAGYEMQNDLPVYHFDTTNANGDDERIDVAIHEMWKKGMDPQDVVSILEDPTSFWEEWDVQPERENH